MPNILTLTTYYHAFSSRCLYVQAALALPLQEDLELLPTLALEVPHKLQEDLELHQLPAALELPQPTQDSEEVTSQHNTTRRSRKDPPTPSQQPERDIRLFFIHDTRLHALSEAHGSNRSPK